ncbi:MAG: SHOCT-like domain-containing protein [Anaerolineae bacterium]
MWTQTVETALSPTIVVEECLGDLSVQGADESLLTLSLRNGADALSLRREGEEVFLTLHAEAHLVCPRAARLTLTAVRGDLQVRDISGPLTVGAVSGDGILRRIGPLTLDETYGDLSLYGATGEVRIREVFGDARLQKVDGPLSVRAVRGDLQAAGLRGGAAVESVGADLRLRPPYVSGATYRFGVGSTARIVIPADANVRFALRAGGRVRSSVPGLSLAEAGGVVTGALGDGEAVLEITAGSHILLVPEVPEEAEWGVWAAGMEDIGAVVAARVAEAMALLEARLEETLRSVDSEVIRRRVEKAAERVRREAEREAERARQEAERARMQAERAERRWQRASGRRPEPSRTAAAEAEILRVLRLVEEGKITPEQAAELIAALEGR